MDWLRHTPSAQVWMAGLVLLIAALIYLGIGMLLVLSMPLEGVQVVSQIPMVFAMLLSPILYPASRLPHWIESIHSLLPFMPVNNVLTDAVTGNTLSPESLAAAIAWALTATILAAIAMTIRKKARHSNRTNKEFPTLGRIFTRTASGQKAKACCHSAIYINISLGLSCVTARVVLLPTAALLHFLAATWRLSYPNGFEQRNTKQGQVAEPRR